MRYRQFSVGELTGVARGGGHSLAIRSRRRKRRYALARHEAEEVAVS
jgi:hypothetical protein